MNASYVERRICIGAHDDEYKKKVLPCPNTECTVTMERAEIKKHLNECEHTVILCKYKNLGCEVGLKRKEKEAMEAHEQDDKAHLHLHSTPEGY